MKTIVIKELFSGKEHKRTIKEDVSITWQFENGKLIIKDYYSGKVLHKYDVSKYGSVRIFIER